MKISSLKLAAIISPLLMLASSAKASPIYTLTAGTASYINNFLGGSLGNTFSFTGPQPVSVQGGGGTANTYSTMQSLNVPFNITLSLIIDDTGNESGPASANGTNYGAAQYTSPTFANVSNSSPITLTAGHLIVSVPGAVSGQMNICVPDSTCPTSGGTNPFDVSFAPLVGTLTVTFAQFNFGSTYTLTNAVFTTATAPEPTTWLFALSGAALFIFYRRSRTA